VAEGRKDSYLKDDREYRAFLVARIQEGWELALDGGRALRGPRLATWVEKVEAFRDAQAKLVSRGYPSDALRAALLGGLSDKRALTDATKVEEVSHVLEASGFRDVTVGHDPEHGTAIVGFTSRRDGVERQVRIDWGLVTSVEYRALATNSPGLEALPPRASRSKQEEEPAAGAGPPAPGEASRTKIEPVTRRASTRRWRRSTRAPRRGSRSSATRASAR
jgi:hypothetical protein